MKVLNYAMFFLIKFMIFFIFVLFFEIVKNGEVESKIIYLISLLLYYSNEEINVEYLISNIECEKKTVGITIYSAIMNLSISFLFIIMFINGYVIEIIIFYIINIILKITFDTSFLEIIKGQKWEIKEKNENKI